MFKKVHVPILGLVQNMSLFHCPHCAEPTAVFGPSDGVRGTCKDHGVDFLGDIPLHPRIGDDAHQGRPTVVAEPGSERAEIFMRLARDIGGKIGL